MEPKKTKILLVEYYAVYRDVLARLFASEGYEVIMATSYEEVLRLLPTIQPDVAFIHFRSEQRHNPVLSGQEIIRCTRQHHPQAAIIVTSAAGSHVVHSALEKMPEGAGCLYWNMDSGPTNLLTTVERAVRDRNQSPRSD